MSRALSRDPLHVLDLENELQEARQSMLIHPPFEVGVVDNSQVIFFMILDLHHTYELP